MRQNLRRALAFALAGVLCLGLLSGCSSFSASDLVQGNLDLIYLNQYTDTYLETVGLTEEEADRQYEDGIAAEAEYFAYYFSIVLDSCDDTIEPQLTELYHRIYDHSKYEVGGVSKNGETYLVELTVYPIDIIQKVLNEDWDSFTADWQARGESGEFDYATEEEYETAWAQGVIDLVSARVETIGYQEPETVSVQVAKDDDGVYSISDNDFSRIDGLMIAY